MLEPFDTQVDKKFLYGSTEACVRLIESLRPEVDNLGIELDMAHVPLMGETFAQAISTAAPYLERVHLGNCVLQDHDHPRYGDTHPPIGYPGGEIDVPELVEILTHLMEIGYLSTARRGSLVMEMTPWPEWSVEDTVSDSMARLVEAWQQV
jgi:sugar phosphate isomerase/epimerase